MTTTIYIYNDVYWHYETFETFIVQCKRFFNLPESADVKIFLYFRPNKPYEKYITKKYPNLILDTPKHYDYYINCTIYDRNVDVIKNSPKHMYIAHEITPRLLKYDNVFYLTPLSNKNYIRTNILPYSDKRKVGSIPVYIVQGNITPTRRNYNLIAKILSRNYDKAFVIKMVGKIKKDLPPIIKKFQSKIIIKNNLDFTDFHKEFIDAYCLLPLISKRSHPQYYTNKLTSSMNYVTAYNLKCVIDKDLQGIYNLENAYVYDNEDDIVAAFEKSLMEFNYPN